MKRASVYLRGGRLYFSSSSQTTAGVWIETSPHLALDQGDTHAAKGRAALEVLNASQESVPHPTDWKSVAAPLLELAGVKSWTTLSKGAKTVNFEVEGGKLEIIPYRNGGSAKGFVAISDKAIELSADASAEHIGAAMEMGLARCE